MTTPLSEIVAAMAPGYLTRLVRQQEALHRAVTRIRRQDFTGLNDLFEATQRIALDAPVFGYLAVGAAAAELHQVIESFRASPSSWDVARLDSVLAEFDDAVNQARLPATRGAGLRRHKAMDEQHAQVA